MLRKPNEVDDDVPEGWRIVDLTEPGLRNVDLVPKSRRLGAALIYAMPPEKGVGILPWVMLVIVFLTPYSLLQFVFDGPFWTVVIGTAFWVLVGLWARKLFR